MLGDFVEKSSTESWTRDLATCMAGILPFEPHLSKIFVQSSVLLNFLIYLYFGGNGVWIQGLVLLGKAFYHLHYAPTQRFFLM
jgi:hypothetical protein